MLRGLFEGPAPWIILAVVVLLFGATRLPALARSLGQSASIFRKEIKDGKAEGDKGEGDKAESTSEEPTASAPSTTGTVKSEAATPADGTAAK
jgi:sec-independent protein translocase protein TatA